jgi:bacterioferritin-associated ferredoxin
MPNDIIICRCEDITLGEIREQIAQGKHTLEEIKRACALVWGLPGKNLCSSHVNEIAKATGKPVSEIPLPKFRPSLILLKWLPC